MVNQVTNPRCRLTYLVDCGTLMFIKTYQILRVEINLFSVWSRTVGGRRAQGRQRIEIHKKSMLQKLSDWIGNGIWTIQTPVNQWRFLVGTISLTLRFPRLPCCNGGGELLQLFRRCFGMFQFLCKWKKNSGTYHLCCSA